MTPMARQQVDGDVSSTAANNTSGQEKVAGSKEGIEMLLPKEWIVDAKVIQAGGEPGSNGMRQIDYAIVPSG